METRAWQLTKRIIEWAKLHRYQNVAIPPWKITEEEARFLHEDLHAKMGRREEEAFRMQLAAMRGVPYEPLPPPSWPPATWKDLHGLKLYGAPLEILPPESVDHMIAADRAHKAWVADLREFEAANSFLLRGRKRLKRSNLIPGWMRRRLTA